MTPRADAADLFIAGATGIPLHKIARASVDIKKRVGGASFPLRFASAADDETIPAHFAAVDIFSADPLEILLAIESATAALAAAHAGDLLAEADQRESFAWRLANDTARALGITKRRAEQMRAWALSVPMPRSAWEEMVRKRAERVKKDERKRKCKLRRAKQIKSKSKSKSAARQMVLFGGQE